MEDKPSKNRSWVLVLAVVVILAASAVSLKATSTTSFCLMCHEMGQHADDLRFSAHAKDKDGIPIGCSQCHLPSGMGLNYITVKIYSGVKDLCVHFLGDPENLDRVAMQKVARRFIDDNNCLACHADLYKDAKGKNAVSELGKIAHDAYLGKNGNAKNGCANCHINMAHLPEFDSYLKVNAAFAHRIQKQEEYR